MITQTQGGGLEFTGTNRVFAYVWGLRDSVIEPITPQELRTFLTHSSTYWRRYATNPFPLGDDDYIDITARMATILGLNNETKTAFTLHHIKGISDLDAVYELQALNHEDFWPELAGALVAAGFLPITAALANDNDKEELIATHEFAPHWYAKFCTEFPATHAIGRLSPKQLEIMTVTSIFEPQRPVTFAPDQVSKAVGWIEMGKRLWSLSKTDADRLIDNSTQASLKQIHHLANIWAELNPALTYTLAGATIKATSTLDKERPGSPWAEAFIAAYEGMDRTTAKFFSRFHLVYASSTIHSQGARIEPERLQAITRRMIRAAREEQRYIPNGCFILQLPQGLEWSAQVKAIAISANETGLWCCALDEYNHRSFWWRWTPEAVEYEYHIFTIAADAMPLVNATMAAFWYDLLTAGETVVIERKGAAQPRGPAPASPPPPTKATTVINLPRHKIIYLTGTRTWSSESDRELIHRQSHGVGGHIRRLHEDWSRSTEAEDNAAEYGIILPDGYTFVQPHIRGARDGDPTPVIARARGLQTIAAMLKVKQ